MSLTVRAKLIVARYGHYLTVLFLLLSAVSLGAAVNLWMYPPTETVTEEVDVEEYAVDVRTEAQVTGSNITLYEPNQRVVDMPVYFYEETPELDIVVNVSTPEGVAVEVDHRLTLALVASRNGVTFFERTRVIDSGTTETTDGGATFRSTIDLLAIRGMVQEERTGTRGIGRLRTSLNLTVSYESDRYDDQLNASTTTVVGEEAFWLEEDLEASETHSQVRTEEVVHQPDIGQIGLYAGVGILLMLFGTGLGWRYLQGYDVERLRTDLARSEFSEWISTGEIPTRADKEYVSVVSLEDLVDIGIDSNKRVIYDSAIEAYAVVDADVVYYYTPADEEIKDWLDV